jgi:hypothetical protein
MKLVVLQHYKLNLAESVFSTTKNNKTMKKLQQNEMKKIKGGVDDELLCLRTCRQAYTLCISLGGTNCAAVSNGCRLKCLGCNPVCP